MLEHRPAAAPASEESPSEVPEPAEPLPEPPSVDLEALQEAWQRSVLPAITERSIPTGTMLAEARPVELAGDELVLEFPPSASFHRQLAEEPKNATLLRDALYEVTGRRLAVSFAVGEDTQAAEEEIAQTEEDFVSLFKDTFDAREIEEER